MYNANEQKTCDTTTANQDQKAQACMQVDKLNGYPPCYLFS